MAYYAAPLAFFTIQEFLGRDGGIVSAAYAPDGLPLLTNVEPLPKAGSLLWAAARALGVEGAPDNFKGTPLEPVAASLDAALRDQRTQNLVLPEGGSAQVLVLPRSLRSLTGSTLLERLFWSSFATTAPAAQDTRTVIPSPEAVMSVTSFDAAPDAAPIPLPKFEIGEAWLALLTTGDGGIVCTRRNDATGWPTFAAKRRFVAERLDSIDGSELELTLPYRTERLAATDHAKYHALLMQEPSSSVWVVSRRACATALIGLARSLSSLHQSGEVHGDLKPANILLTSDGAVAIDSLNLRNGERSVAMTRGWAAPEQVLGLPVSAQTDQYAFGMLLLELVKGVLFGEEAQITIPVGGRSVERHTLLRNPGVFVDPETAPVVAGAVGQWRDLIERCVRFTPEDRFASMTMVVEKIEALVSAESLQGEYRMPLAFGALSVAQGTNGESGAAWLV